MLNNRMKIQDADKQPSIYLLPTTFIHFVGSKYILGSYAQHGMKGIKIADKQY
jgi:hypothetical protein